MTCLCSRGKSPYQSGGDAARNRALLLEAARRLIARSGADAITMDDVAAAAGVGKGTLFRRFGSRAGLMMVLLDEDERASQQAFLFGPPPLGPDAPPLDRLIAFGRERMRFVMPITSCCRKPTGIHKPATARRYRYCAPICGYCWPRRRPPATWMPRPMPC